MSLIRELIEKHAALKEDVKLRDHQEKAVNITGNRVNFAHPVGSGKTLTGIAKFEKLKEQGEAGKALVIVPSSLRDNFAAKGVEKFTDSTYNVVGTKDEVKKGLAHNPTPDADYNIVSYEIFRRDPEYFLRSTGADTVILDENHRTKNEDTMTSKSFDNELYRQQVKNFIGLTGSITSNTPADMVPLVNIASRGEANIGKNKNEFLDRYAIRDNSKIYRGYAENRKPIVGFRNRQQLQSELAKYIHFMGDDEIKEIANMPDKDLDVTYVPISKEQKKLYQKMLKDDPEMRKLITRKRFDTLKDEEISRAYSQLVEMRKLMNDPSSVIAKGEKGSPKLDRMIDDLEAHLNSTPDGQALLFSHLINGGVSSIEEELLERGLAYDKFIGKGNNGVTEQSRQQAVKDYNDRKNRILLISSAGGEGISLDDTTFEGVLDPHFNPERMNQMEARGIRSGGLAHRQEGERVVDVNRYLATMPKTLGIFKSPVLTPDEMIYRIAQNKERQNKIVHDMLKNVRAQQERDYMKKQAAEGISLGERADELYEDRILPYAKNYVTGSLPGQAIGIGGALALLRTQKGKAFSDSLKQSVKNPLLRVLVKGGLLGIGSSIGSSIGRGTSRGVSLHNEFEDQLGRTPTLSEYGKSVPVAMIPFVGGAIATPEAMARKIKEGEEKMANTLIGGLIEKMAGDGYEGDITLDVATGLAGSALIAGSSDSLLGRKQLYHGTSKENASKIKREGLNPEMGGSGGASDKVSNPLIRDKFKNNSKGYVHVTGREPIARMFANFDGSDFTRMPNVVKITNPDGEVLKLKVPYNDFKNMIVDEDIMPGLSGADSNIAKAIAKELGAKSDKTISAKYIKGSGEYHKGALDAIKRLPEYISENPRRFGIGAAGSTAGLAALLSLVKDGDSDDSVEKRAYEEAIEKALATDLEKKVAQMMATSHEYKKPNIQGALTFVKNYTWEERTIPLSRLQGINKPIKQEKVFEIARTLEQNGDKVEWPFIVVNKIHGIKPQTHSKVILLDGHHRAEACKARGIKEVPVYFGTYTGGAEIDDEELYKEVPNEKTASDGASDFEKALAIELGLVSSALIANKSTDAFLGQKTLYHGTTKENASKIKQEGLLASKGGIGGSSDAHPSEFLKSIYKARSSGKIHATAVPDVAKFFATYASGDMPSTFPINKVGPNGEILKLKVPYEDFMNMEIDEDVLGSNTRPKALVGKDLREIGVKTDKDIGVSSIVGKDGVKRLKRNLENLPSYVKNNPRRFAAGASGVGLASIIAGLSGKGIKDFADTVNERDINEKAAVGYSDLLEKLAGIDHRALAYNKEDLEELLRIIEAEKEGDVEVGSVEYALEKGILPYDTTKYYPDRGFGRIMMYVTDDVQNGLNPLGFVDDAYGVPAPIFKRDDSKKYLQNIGSEIEEQRKLVTSGKGYYGELLNKSKGELQQLTSKNFISRLMNREKINTLKGAVKRYSESQRGAINQVEAEKDFYDTVIMPAYEEGHNDPNNEAFFWHYASESDLLEKTAEEIIEKKIVTQDDLYTVARIVHEINRHYNKLLMDREDPSWDELDERDKANRISLLSETVPDIKKISAKKMHDMWVAQQEKEGWAYGEKYDKKKKTHPCIVSWTDLPELEKAKDAMYLAVIKSMTELHFGIDKTISDKIKEVKIPGGEKVLMNKSATFVGQLIEKQASARSEKRKAIEQTLRGSQPSNRYENLAEEIGYEEWDNDNNFEEDGRLASKVYPGLYLGGEEFMSVQNEQGDDLGEALDERYNRNLNELLAGRPDLAELVRVNEEQRKKSGRSYVGNVTLPLGFAAGAGAGVFLPAKGIHNSIKEGRPLAAAGKTLAFPVTAGLGLVGGGLAGLAAGSAVGELFDAPIRGIRYLKDRDYAAYDNFTDAQAQEIARARAEAMARAERETEDLLLPKRATLVGQLIEKQASEADKKRLLTPIKEKNESDNTGSFDNFRKNRKVRSSFNVGIDKHVPEEINYSVASTGPGRRNQMLEARSFFNPSQSALERIIEDGANVAFLDAQKKMGNNMLLGALLGGVGAGVGANRLTRNMGEVIVPATIYSGIAGMTGGLLTGVAASESPKKAYLDKITDENHLSALADLYERTAHRQAQNASDADEITATNTYYAFY